MPSSMFVSRKEGWVCPAIDLEKSSPEILNPFSGKDTTFFMLLFLLRKSFIYLVTLSSSSTKARRIFFYYYALDAYGIILDGNLELVAHE